MRAACLGVVKRLQDALGDATGSYVGFRPNLRPPPAAGQWYIAVGQNSGVDNGVYACAASDYRYTVAVCLTFKYGYVPDDRLASVMTASGFDFALANPELGAAGRPPTVERWEVQPGIVELAELVHDLVVEDYECLQAMNFYLGTDKNDDEQAAASRPQVDSWWGFAEPFHSGTMGPVTPQDASWVGGAVGGGDGSDYQTLTLTVAGARFIRPIRYLRGLDRGSFTDS